MKTQSRLGALLCAFFFATTILTFGQGSLTPPAAPTPTMKTLDQVQPRVPIDATHTPGDGSNQFIISVPGSYYLTGNIAGVAGKNGIFINSGLVTVDLNGFALFGAPSSGNGIVSGVSQNVAVYNGTIQSWGGLGVDIEGPNAAVSDLLVSNNGGTGVKVGSGATVRHCNCASNAVGFVTGQSSHLIDCIARNHTSGGISTSGECRVSNCQADFNSGAGIQTAADCTVENSSGLQNGDHGIQVGNSCSVLDSRAVGNGNDGIIVGSGSLVRGCVASSSTFYGISLGGGSSALDCVIQFNRVGIYLQSGCTVSRCTATSNIQGIGSEANEGVGCTITHCTASSNTSAGINATAGCHISDCTVRNNATGIATGSDCSVQSCTAVSNTGTGISVGGSGGAISGCTVNSNASTGISNNSIDGGCLITGCIVELNGNSGIFVRKNCRVMENHCSRQTSGDGISVAGDGNHIEGNTCDDNTAGFAVQFLSGANNVLLRNRAHGNTVPQYRFQGANASYGPIVDLASGDISGTANASHPMANYRY